MKTIFQILLALLLLLATAGYAQDNWTLQSPATQPSIASFHAMASIGGDQVLLFGGEVGGSPDNATWVYDLIDNTWTFQNTLTKPSPVIHPGMATIGGDKVLLFGGLDYTYTFFDSTWIYDLSDNSWTEQSNEDTVPKPPARSGHAMAYIGGDKVLLFGGGITTAEVTDNTWVYDLSDNTWTLQSPTTKPSARTEHAMAFIGDDKVLLFGGFSWPSMIFYDDTWIYDLSDNTWTLQNPTTKPSAQDQHAMAFIGGGKVLLFSGYVGTWVYAAGSITPLPGNIEGTVFVGAVGLGGVTVKLLDDEGFPVAGVDPVLTNNIGDYSFTLLPPGDYQVMILEPLGYVCDQNPKSTTLGANSTNIVNFTLTQTVVTNEARSKGYWKHQFDVYITGRGHAQETDEQLNEYITEAQTNYTPHFNVFAGMSTFLDWQAVLTVGNNQPMINRAKAQLAALLMNLVSLKIGQYTVVTADNRTAGDVLTYVSELIIDGDASNDELAKDLAEQVNLQQQIASGIVPQGNNLYKVGDKNLMGSADLPTEFELFQNYPNPFNPTTKIKYQLPVQSFVTLKVYDVLGNEIAILVNEEKPVGSYEIDFKASSLPSGIYFYKLQAGSFLQIKKMVLLK
jgi:N-acetylneuraminic acid mutarotase